MDAHPGVSWSGDHALWAATRAILQSDSDSRAAFGRSLSRQQYAAERENFDALVEMGYLCAVFGFESDVVHEILLSCIRTIEAEDPAQISVASSGKLVWACAEISVHEDSTLNLIHHLAQTRPEMSRECGADGAAVGVLQMSWAALVLEAEPEIIAALLDHIARYLKLASFSGLGSLHSHWTKQVLWHNRRMAEQGSTCLEVALESASGQEEEWQNAALVSERHIQFKEHICSILTELNLRHEAFAPEEDSCAAFPSVVAALPAQRAVLDLVQAHDLLSSGKFCGALRLRRRQLFAAGWEVISIERSKIEELPRVKWPHAIAEVLQMSPVAAARLKD